MTDIGQTIALLLMVDLGGGTTVVFLLSMETGQLLGMQTTHTKKYGGMVSITLTP